MSKLGQGKAGKKKNEKTANVFGESSSVVFVVGLEQADEG